MKKILERGKVTVWFREEDHTYWKQIGDILTRIPGVTEVIGYAGPTGRRAEYCMTRGSYVHKDIYLHVLGALDESTIDPAVVPFLDSFREWEAKTSPLFIENEKSVVSQQLDVAGTFDALISFPADRERKIYLDYKSGAPTAAHIIQVTGYGILDAGSKWLQRATACLYLQKNGKIAKYREFPLIDQMDAGHRFRRMVYEWWDKNTAIF